MRLGIVGAGTVGRATARAYLEHVEELRVYDVLPERRTHPLEEVLACDLVFVNLPTPQGPDGRCDLSAVEGFFASVGGSRADFALRSTVPPGTTRRLSRANDVPSLVHHPEFLTARCAVADAHQPARNVVGGPDCPAKHKLAALLRRRFPGVPLHLLRTSDESEVVKLATNGFFAVKIAYWNELFALCEHLMLGWDDVMAAVLADGRISHAHTRVPGPSGGFGFSGHCLPKDLSNLSLTMADLGLCNAVTAGALERNRLDRRR